MFLNIKKIGPQQKNIFLFALIFSFSFINIAEAAWRPQPNPYYRALVKKYYKPAAVTAALIKPTFTGTGENTIVYPDTQKSPTVKIKLSGEEQRAISRDFLILEQQLNLVTKEANESREKLKLAEDNLLTLQQEQKQLIKNFESLKFSNNFLSNLLTGFLVFIGLAFLILLLILYKFKKSSDSDFKIEMENIIHENKQEIINHLDLQPLNLNNLEETLSEKINEFYHSLNNQSKQVIDNVKTHLNTSLSDFEQEIEPLVSNYHNEIIQAKDEKINNLPECESAETIDTESIMSKIVDGKIDLILNNMSDKEKLIIDNIQKVNLAHYHFNKGNIFFRESSYYEAIDEFSEAIKIDTNFYGAYINLGKAYEFTNQLTPAREAYKKAVRLMPRHYKAWFNLGILLSKQQNSIDAINSYKKVIELKPDHYKAYNNLGITYQILEKLEEARFYFDRALKCNSNYIDAYINLAKVEKFFRNEKIELNQIVDFYLKKYSASLETVNTVKNIIKNISEIKKIYLKG